MTVRPPHLLVVDPDVAGPDYQTLGTAASSPDEVRDAATRLRRLAEAGSFTAPPEPATLVYRLAVGDHQQTGVVVEVPVDDYSNGRVRRHEATRPDRERELAELLAVAETEVVPVMLTHPTRPRLRTLLAEAASAEPDVAVVAHDGLVQSVWIVRGRELAEAIQAELAAVDRLYIADGHHRMAVAEAYAARHHRAGEERASDFVLGSLFPADEMRILGYHRGVSRPASMADADVLTALSEQPLVERLEPCRAPEPAPGVVAVYVDGGWHRLQLRRPEGPGARGSLDIVALDEGVLSALTADDADSGGAVTPLPGSFDAADLAQWCREHRAVGFLVHPPSVEQLMAVSDAGELMPAKSTWFDPKARAGPFLRDLRC